MYGRSCYSGYSKRQLNVPKDFDNLRVDHIDEQFRLLLRKGVYPYEYMSSCDISKYEYEREQKVWKEFKL